MPGLTLIYGADQRTALAGDTVVFTAWVINDSPHLLRAVQLVPGSFTNEGLENLAYTPGLDASVLLIGRLNPGEAAERSFSYTVRSSDVAYGGELVSGMRVRADTPSQTLWDEQDAIVTVI